MSRWLASTLRANGTSIEGQRGCVEVYLLYVQYLNAQQMEEEKNGSVTAEDLKQEGRAVSRSEIGKGSGRGGGARRAERGSRDEGRVRGGERDGAGERRRERR